MKSHLIAVAFLTGCGATTHLEEPVSVTTTTSAAANDTAGVDPSQGMREAPPIVVLGDDAVSQIASVQCSHEVACGNVGENGTYVSFDVCVGEMRNIHRPALTGEVCPKGVNPYALQQCIEESRASTCGESATSCSSVRLCR